MGVGGKATSSGLSSLEPVMNWMPRVQATGTAKPANYRQSVRVLDSARPGPGAQSRGEALILPRECSLQSAISGANGHRWFITGSRTG
jgi:hypothetical protein